MTRSNITRALVLLATLTLSPALAKGHRGDMDSTTTSKQQTNKNRNFEDTITWWCVDLNEVWKVKETVIVGFGGLVGDPSFTPYCGDPDRFPITVPAGSTFMPGGLFYWTTNKTYPAAYAAAVEAQGFTFSPHSNSPAEDFRSKIVQVRVDVFTLETGDPVAAFTFDAQKNLKLVQYADLFGPLGPVTLIDPALGIDLSSAEFGRLPTYGFPVRAGPVPPGEYFYCISYALSAEHWDGLGVDPFLNLLPAGEFVYGCNAFNVAP